MDISKEFDFLNQQIKIVSELMDQLVEDEEPIQLNYKQEKVYLCLIRKKARSGECIGLRWERFKYVNMKQIWMDGWPVGKVPNTTVKCMGAMDKIQFQDTNKLARKLVDMREKLINKKKQIHGVFSTVRQYDAPALATLKEDMQGM